MTELRTAYHDYVDSVLMYLEYMGWHDYMEGFEPIDVAHCLENSTAIAFSNDIPFRTCALMVFGASFKALMNTTKDMVKH
jgi:hypothetical protein